MDRSPRTSARPSRQLLSDDLRFARTTAIMVRPAERQARPLARRHISCGVGRFISTETKGKFSGSLLRGPEESWNRPLRRRQSGKADAVPATEPRARANPFHSFQAVRSRHPRREARTKPSPARRPGALSRLCGTHLAEFAAQECKASRCGILNRASNAVATILAALVVIGAIE